MEYKNTLEAELIKRENRFIALVNVDNKVERVHVPNTGRCKELFIQGAKVLLSKASDTKKRKTAYSLVHVEKDGRWINIDSQSPNKLVEEYLNKKRYLPGFGPISQVKREVTYGNSRLDFKLLSEDGREAFVEVKGVTLEKNGHGFFPDAPTLRGAKHMLHLKEISQKGKIAYAIFVIQMKKIHTFSPNWKMDEAFCQALIEAKESGARILALDTKIHGEKMVLDKEVFIHYSKAIAIEKATEEDDERILKIYQEAKESLKEDGVDQWQNEGPNIISLREDREKSRAYIYKSGNEVLAVGSLQTEEEPSYKTLFDGHWPNEEPYGTIHRFALAKDAQGQGLGQSFLQALVDRCFELGLYMVRIDTHQDNEKMLHLLQTMGFHYCGRIYLADGSQRKAFIKELK